MRTPKVGDVIEFPVDSGFGYAQFCNWNEDFGALVRVFAGVRHARPDDLSELVDADEQFLTFMLLHKSVRLGIVSVIGNVSVPERFQTFPIMRAGARGPGSSRTTWWLWDGNREWRADELTREQQKLSLRELVGLQVIQDRIRDGWRPCDQLEYPC